MDAALDALKLVPGSTVADLKICNPADLDPSRREAVCNQCHLGGEATVPDDMNLPALIGSQARCDEVRRTREERHLLGAVDT